MGKPTLEMARAMPVTTCHFSNDTLIVLSQRGDHEACTERLVRHIMVVDGMEWDDANKTMHKIKTENNAVLWYATLSGQIGFAVAGLSGIASIPMVFHLPTVRFCNIW